MTSTAYTAVLCLLVSVPVGAADSLVVCPDEFRPALIPWVEHRQQQGHAIVVVPPHERPEELKATIARAAFGGELKYLVLIGDVAGPADSASDSRTRVPTNYVRAKVNMRWGSEPTIASDIPYGDMDGDGLADIAVGRIPADDADELAAAVGKIIRCENAEFSPTDQRLNVVSGVGGFGSVTDALLDAAARQVIQQTVPKEFEVQQTSANPASAHCPSLDDFRPRVCRQLNGGGFAWVYLGHGRATELDRVATSMGKEPILSVEDVPGLRCGPQSPLAVLIACYTGAMDAKRDCLAEELLLAEGGPVAVIAATRVTMPYGNTVLGYELLRACFHDRPSELGSVLLLAQRRTLQNAPEDPLRRSLDVLAAGLSPPPVNLELERREHVAMYHLFGDPLMRLRWPPEGSAHTAAADSLVK